MSGFEKYRASVSLWDTHLTVAEQEILFEHAYNAGFREASDKAATLPMRAMYDAGYEQGVAAERERCAGIAALHGGERTVNSGYNSRHIGAENDSL